MAQNLTIAVFTKRDVFKIAPKYTNILGYFCKEMCHQELQKLPNGLWLAFTLVLDLPVIESAHEVNLVSDEFLYPPPLVLVRSLEERDLLHGHQGPAQDVPRLKRGLFIFYLFYILLRRKVRLQKWLL